MPRRKEIRNSTAEFLIFQVEGKEQGVGVYYKDKTVWCTQRADGYARENIIVIEEKESGIKLKEEERLGLNRMKQHIETDSEIDCVYN